MKELMIREELKGLDPSKAEQIEAIFTPMVTMLKSFEGQFDAIVESEINADTCNRAKRLRLDIAKVRTGADKLRGEQKAEYLRAGNAIQGVYNILKFAVTEKEEKLKEIENHFVRLAEEKVKRLQAERELELSKYDIDGSQIDLGVMDDMIWSNFLSGTKTNYEAVKEAELEAEKQRLKDVADQHIYASRKEKLRKLSDFYDWSLFILGMSKEEFQQLLTGAEFEKQKHVKRQEEIRLENERLKKEREEKERQIEAERVEREEILQKEKAERERIEKIEQEKREKALEALKAERAENERLRVEAETKANKERLLQEQRIKKEREEKAKLNKELAEKKAQEKVERELKAEQKKTAELAPDKEKLEALLITIKACSVTSAEAKRIIVATAETVYYGIQRLK